MYKQHCTDKRLYLGIYVYINIHVYKYMHVIINSEKEAISLKESGEGQCEGGKGKEKYN